VEAQVVVVLVQVYDYVVSLDHGLNVKLARCLVWTPQASPHRSALKAASSCAESDASYRVEVYA
jgi:hypothetical protein